MVVELSRASLIRSSHAQGRGFESGYLQFFFEFEMVGQERNLDFLEFSDCAKSRHVIPKLGIHLIDLADVRPTSY